MKNVLSTRSWLLLVVLTLTACAGGQKSSKKTAQQAIGPESLTVSGIQSELMSFADTFSDLVSQGADSVAASTDNPRVRADAQQIKTSSILGAFTIAATPNPVIGVIDMAVMVTLLHQSARLWDARFFENHGDPLLHALVQAEALVWKMAGRLHD